MDSSANWIWIPQDDGSRNLTVCARRTFSLSTRPEEAHLEISANSRFVLYINGERVGQGPARSWNEKKQYDTYEVSRYLQEGDNVIAVQVARWGVKASYQPNGPGGLIAALIIYGKPVVSTDGSWKIAENPAYTRRVPRMTGGMCFTEQYDARLELDWTADFDDSEWQTARVLGPVGTEPWIEMTARSIPYLTEQPMYPVRVFDICAVEPPRYSYAFDVHDAVRKHDKENPSISGAMVAELVSDRDAEVTLVRMHQTWNMDVFGQMRVNGKDVAFTEDRATFPVNAGSNLLVTRYHQWWHSEPSWVFETDAEIEMHTPVGDPGGPVAMYVCKSSLEEPAVAGCWDAQSVDNLRKWLPELRPLRPDERYVDVFALSHMRYALPDVSAVIDSPYALCSASSEYAVVRPPTKGDLEFLLDFGEEIVGLIEFEVDAPEETIIDFNCFEAIQGTEWQWTDNLNNTIRYTAREGWQKFHSVVRRGFRYAQVTVRNASRPVRIREILCLQNTYPVQYEGAFSCSDTMLTKIWELGRRTTRLCMEDTFVDCPAYEQTFWVGDARNEALAAYAAFGDSSLAEWCLRLVPESLWRSPIPECATPSGNGGIIPDWSMFWVLACEEYFRYTGNIQFTKDILPSILQTCRFMLSKRNEQGLWQYAAMNMLDWAPMDCPPDAVIAHENILLVETLRRAAVLTDVAGAHDGDELRREADALKSAINKHFWNDEHRAYVDSIHADGALSSVISQQTQTMAYLYDCVPPERMAWIEGYLTEVPDGWVKVSTPWMLWFSLESLAKKGDFSTILDVIRKYWGLMLEMDATTCWEHFCWTSGRWKPTRSWCHAWSAAPTYFLSTCQLGVQLLESGDRVVIAPEPCGLIWAKGRVPTIRGTISASWKVESGKFDMTVILPPGVEADVKSPQGYEIGKIDIFHSPVTTSPVGVGN